MKSTLPYLKLNLIYIGGYIFKTYNDLMGSSNEKQQLKRALQDIDTTMTLLSSVRQSLLHRIKNYETK